MALIRKGKMQDVETIARFQQHMAAETEGLALDPARVSAGVKHIMESPSKGYYLVAEAEGKIIGCMMALYEWSDWRNGNVIWIHSVYITPGNRNLGVFRQMYQSIEAEVMGNDSLFGIRLYVDKRNLNAIRVYQNVGMNDAHYSLFEWLKG